MTNKLLRVIDNKIKACKGIYGFFPQNDHTNDQELCVKVEIVELLMQEGLEELLDAIIEDMENDIDKKMDKICDLPFQTQEGYRNGMCIMLNLIKQARE